MFGINKLKKDVSRLQKEHRDLLNAINGLKDYVVEYHKFSFEIGDMVKSDLHHLLGMSLEIVDRKFNINDIYHQPHHAEEYTLLHKGDDKTWLGKAYLYQIFLDNQKENK